METNFLTVTELADDKVTKEQVIRLCNRYYWAEKFCSGKDVVEAGCGTGQGLGYLASIAKSFEAGDYDCSILSIAQKNYGNRIALQQFDAQNMPFYDNSKDVVILFEAIYYIPDVERFIKECVRVLRSDGKVLIATANKDLYDFNPSPHSYKYYGVLDLKKLFIKNGFSPAFYGNMPISEASITERMLRPVKKAAVSLKLIPKTMNAKKLLKRIIFGQLVKMPAEITADTVEYIKPNPIPSDVPDKTHKVIYCAATHEPKNY
jgi:ubiquinone/menaquinone biosynthesis C-methylase UbiE